MLLVNTILELPRSFQVLIINYILLNLAFKAFTLSATYIFFFFHLTSYRISNYNVP